MSLIKEIILKIKEKPHIFGAYILTINYIEIIHYLIVVVIFFGKFTTVLSGILLMGLLTACILFLYYRVPIARMIILIYTDIHVAMSIVYIIFFIASGNEANTAKTILFISRLILVPSELLLIYLLSSEEGKLLFNKKEI